MTRTPTRTLPFVLLTAGLALGCGGGDDSASNQAAGGSGGTSGAAGTSGSSGSSGAAGSGGSGGASEACPSGGLAPGDYDYPLDHDGVHYSYLLHVPAAHDGTARVPLVLNWHGLTSNAGQQQGFSLMNPVSDRDGFIVAYPNSPDNSWNAGSCCAFQAMSRDDVGFARAVVVDVETKACIDAKRVYTTGMSNGGYMSHRLACEASDVFAAAAPVAGLMGITTCEPPRGVPIFDVSGTADTLVSYAQVPATMDGWVARDACTAGPDVTFQKGTVTCKTWSACKDGAEVTLCTAEGEGHCWPGQTFCPYGATTTDMDASSEISKFFQKFSLP